MTAPSPVSPPSEPTLAEETTKPRRAFAGWVLVAIAAIVAAITVWFGAEFTGFYGPTSGAWVDGALFALGLVWFGAAISILLAVLALIFGKGIWVRVIAAVLIVGVVPTLMVAGGFATVGRYAAAPKAPDCMGQGVAVAPEIQAAFDELEHTGWVDTIMVGTDACGVAVRNLSLAEASDFYGEQLVAVGWVIEESDDTHLNARRDGYTFTISACGVESFVEITAEAGFAQGC